MNDASVLRGTLLVSALLLGACAAPDGSPSGVGPSPPDADDRNLVEPGYDGRFAVGATVLESPEHGPQLCAAVADSYPPQCGGPDLVGWDWDEVDAESAAGTTWGEYQLVGTWDGERFTLTEPATRYDPTSQPDRFTVDFTSPCPEPADGWQPVDPALTSDQAMQDAFARADQSPQYAGGWIDQLNDLDDDRGDTEEQPEGRGPRDFVLNLRFTGDLERHEQEIREVWGGPLCVSGADHTEAELSRIQAELHDLVPGVLSSGQDVVMNAVTASVMVATTEQQAELDQRYGEGAVLLSGYLEPID